MDLLIGAEWLLPAAGGAERFALGLAEELAARGHRLRVVTTAEATAPAPPPLPGVAWRVAPDPGPRAFPAWAHRRERAARLARAVADELAAAPADAVLTQLTAGPAVLDAARAAATPGVLLLANREALRDVPRGALAPADAPAWEATRRDHARALRAAALLVAPSDHVAGLAQARCGRRPLVVPPVTRLPPPARPSRDGPVLLIAAYWTAEKGAALLGPIAAALAPRRVVVQAGDGGREMPLPPGLAALCNLELRLAPAETATLLGGAALLLVPSQLDEPFGRVAWEGLAAGVPTLTSEGGGLREYVPAAQRVADAGDPEAWAAAARALLADEEAWATAARRGPPAARTVLARGGLDALDAALRRIPPRPPAPGGPTAGRSGARRSAPAPTPAAPRRG